MKATKNQAAAVRSYLSTLGLNISHVQALEVIARGAGQRSRHVKAPAVHKADQAELPADTFERAMALCVEAEYPANAVETVDRLVALFPELFVEWEDAQGFLVDGMDGSVGLQCEVLCLANAIRDEYLTAGRTQVALAKALRSLVQDCSGIFKEYRSAYVFLTGLQVWSVPEVVYTQEAECNTCGTKLDAKGYCKDETCFHSDWPQQVERARISELPTAEVERLYGVKKRVRSEDLSPADRLAQKYEVSGEHPDYPRGDWLFLAAKQRTEQTYWEWVVTRLESIDSEELLSPEDLSDRIKETYEASGCQRVDLTEALNRLLSECSELFEDESAAMAFLLGEGLPEMVDVGDEMAQAEEIKTEYLEGRCHADDVDHAVQRLMSECPNLYSDSRKAWGFIMDETHEELETVYVVQEESMVFGTEVSSFYSEEELRAGLIRTMAKAVDMDDNIERKYYVSEVDAGIEKGSPAYTAALQDRKLEGHITAEGMVRFQGNDIGYINALTEGGLTLYSWIDSNP